VPSASTSSKRCCSAAGSPRVCESSPPLRGGSATESRATLENSLHSRPVRVQYYSSRHRPPVATTYRIPPVSASLSTRDSPAQNPLTRRPAVRSGRGFRPAASSRRHPTPACLLRRRTRQWHWTKAGALMSTGRNGFDDEEDLFKHTRMSLPDHIEEL